MKVKGNVAMKNLKPDLTTVMSSGSDVLHRIQADPEEDK